MRLFLQRRQNLVVILVQKGLVSSQQKARAMIMEGRVFVDGQKVVKAGSTVSPHSHIAVQEEEEFVSRGGWKLKGALEEFGIVPHNKVVLDAGASTGGFTDCLLKCGAQKVIAVDVGYGQLDWSLQKDPRVIVMDRTNVRYLKAEDLPFLPDLITVDLSFISLKKVVDALMEIVKPGGELLFLVKPQFEAGPHQVGKGGVVKDRQVQREVLWDMVQFLMARGVSIYKVSYSRLKGAKGNLEFWIYGRKEPGDQPASEDLWAMVEQAVEEAHLFFGRKEEQEP
ncbi:23S rRNA (cytidine1920-2'-O)/16S rRNA (cytidine1409-2'-O)-methyltransferase [Candidatus Hakubella thermalkaliphila]|uniref:23S rRNA (Cytidine1920-2'-O)/16S rRNA (Cytidine1409-2'-O)-methyltransferase n=1 Tax=Candidatus Hakubella thermalkaliphila TaxID=2754717 RepID=A0A6V8NNR1_9ACTN|nr:TlyA family RNA methyltransferase [Candidatus Hakubella thermalkaliphila]GFP20940.1 23S rRNA (cytidine1920-2'-O)/16S rRNA (cytidine1409-2'-O)-methyltransferase [Candidatus Hakubella thermalkaliphila]